MLVTIFSNYTCTENGKSNYASLTWLLVRELGKQSLRQPRDMVQVIRCKLKKSIVLQPHMQIKIRLYRSVCFI